MKSLTLQKEVRQISTIAGLTSIFESIASMRISKIKDKVATSQGFFDELWGIYTQLRVSSSHHESSGPKRDKPNVFLVLTSDGGLSGDIDDRIVKRVMADYKSETTDLIVIGSHGSTLLSQRHANIKRIFRLPDIDDQAVDVGPIVDELAGYANPSVYYQKYISLSVQEVDTINLLNRVQALGDAGESDNAELITTRDYLFEPSPKEVVAYLEGVMMQIALGQVILESRLAQYASRFSAMSAAHDKAQELQTDTNLAFHRAKRLEGDERLKEVINAMKLS